MEWQDIVVGLAGVWLVISAFLKIASAQLNFWNYLIVGVIVAVLGFWSMFSSSSNNSAS